MGVCRKVFTQVLPSTLFIILLSACSKSEATAEPSPPPTNNSQLTANEQKILNLVNDARARGCNCGSDYMPPVGPVTWNDQLENAARSHSEFMKQTNHMSHTGANGSSAGDRITASGFTWRTYGENIAVGYQNEEEVMKGWLNSPGHCKNIMNSAFKEMGVASAGNFWTQVFAARK